MGIIHAHAFADSFSNPIQNHGHLPYKTAYGGNGRVRGDGRSELSSSSKELKE